MNRFVVDASAWVELVCGREHWRRIADALLGDAELHVPALCDVEVVAALRKLTLHGRLSSMDARQAIDNYRAARTERHDHEPLLPRMFELRDNCTAYDAAYVALAEALDARLATLDSALARTARRSPGIAVLDFQTDPAGR